MNAIKTQHDENRPLVSVIIPTTCEVSRAELLLRAINSVRNQEGVVVEVLVVSNGPRQDESLLAHLELQERVRIIRMHEGNVSKARYAGVCDAQGDFYCFLDDDDEFLPNCLNRRLEVMLRDPECDVVVNNGLIHVSGTEAPLVSSVMASEINSDLCLTFLRQNWFASPASMFRSKRIEDKIFCFEFKYFEWTYLFFLLFSMKKKIVFENSLSYRKFEDNPLSVSKTVDYSLAHPGFLQVLKDLDLPTKIKSAIQKKYITALNGQSIVYLSQGEWIMACKSHLACLASGGWRYIPYTRHLLLWFVK